ncbi:MAG: hypothetical protein WKF58_03400 [Ilumatobacteraceae bacterium]
MTMTVHACRDRGACGGEDDSGGGNDFESTIDRIPASALEGVGDSSPELYYSDMAIRWDELELADADAGGAIQATVRPPTHRRGSRWCR